MPTVEPVMPFSDVDAADAAELVSMMDATDRWPAVRAARDWVLERAGTGGRSLDVGAGPGTFHAGAGPRWTGVDVDAAAAMVAADRTRHPDALVVRADGERLPIATGTVDLVHAERVLQWAPDPGAILHELVRVAAPSGLVAVTDTDWSTLSVDHPDDDAAARLSAAALRWVRWPTLARTVPRRLVALGLDDVEVRAGAVTLSGWEPDAPGQEDGPPGLPLRTIAAAAGPGGPAAHDVDRLGTLARTGRFLATLTVVTTMGRRPR
ncbi:methyltransferase domain-containing protein [Dermatobacter hominis]|uniref:methyltransferase domain-containing protein n=1 Tax=Dermatobacter hominis TaxID=2884263 RepID=UPI001D118D0F|nr:methyltransferase domain-containing protein [Dermatobacter hominis]UDY35344.1 methyltransferase domain-containing protein [Dermatobacter hominis]